MRFQKINNLKKIQKRSIFLIFFCSIFVKIYIHDRSFNFLGRLVLKKNRKLLCERSRIFNFISFFQISQYYSIQNFIGFGKINQFSLLILNKTLDFNLNKKFVDALLQSFFGRTFVILRNSLDFIKIKNSKLIENSIQKKWNSIFNLIKDPNILKQKGLKTTYNHIKNYFLNFKCSKKCKKKSDLDFNPLYFRLVNKLQKNILDFKIINIFENITIFFLYLLIHGDVFYGVLFKDLFKFCNKLEFFSSKIFFNSFYLMFNEHFSKELIFSVFFSEFKTQFSFVCEKINFLKSKINLRENNISRVKNSTIFISRGFFYRVIKINNNYCGEFSNSLNYQNRIMENFFIQLERSYSNLSYTNLKYIQVIKDQNTSFPSPLIFEGLWVLLEKLKVIIIHHRSEDKKYRKNMNSFFILTNIMLKKVVKENKIKLFLRIFILISNVFLNFNSKFAKKFFLVSLVAMQFNESIMFLHELVFSKNVFLLMKKINLEKIINRKKNIEKILYQCKIIREIKKIFLQKKYQKIHDNLILKLRIQEKEKNKQEKFINFIVDKFELMDSKFLTNQKLKFSLIESYKSLVLFSTNKLVSFFRKIKFNPFKEKKINPLKFHYLKRQNKREIRGICIFCFHKKKKKVLDLLKIIVQNFDKLKKSEHTRSNHFSIFFSVFNFFTQLINDTQTNFKKKNNEEVFSISKQCVLVKKIRFPSNKALSLRRFLKLIEINFNKHLTSSIFQNAFFFLQIHLNIKLLFLTKKIFQTVNLFKNIFSEKISGSLTSLIEIIIHKKKTFSGVTNKKIIRKIDFSINPQLLNFSQFKFLKETEFNHRNLIQNFKESFSEMRISKKKNLFIKIYINIGDHQKFEENKKKNRKKNYYPNKSSLVFKKFYGKYIYKKGYYKGILNLFASLFKSHSFKIFCESLKCNFYSNFNFLLKISNKFLKKVNSSIFFQTISKLKIFFYFAKKKTILTRNFMWKYKENKHFHNKSIKKKGKFFRELIYFKKLNEILFIGLFFFSVCTIKQLKFSIGSKKRYSSKTNFKNFPLKFLGLNVFFWFFKITKIFNAGAQEISVFKKGVKNSFKHFFPMKGLLNFPTFLKKIKFFNFSIEPKDKTDNLNTTFLKNIETDILFPRPNIKFFMLLVTNFIFLTKKIIQVPVIHLLSLKTKSNNASLNLKLLYFLFPKSSLFICIKKKIEFLLIMLIFQTSFRFFNFSKWIYQPKSYISKTKEEFYLNLLKEFFKRKKKKKILKICQIPFIFKKIKIKKIIKFYDKYYHRFSQNKRNIKEEEKYQKNNNLIIKKKNFKEIQSKRINSVNSKKNLSLFYFLNVKIKSSNLLKNFSKNLKEMERFIKFKFVKFTQVSILNEGKGEIFQHSKLGNVSFSFFKLFFSTFYWHLFCSNNSRSSNFRKFYKKLKAILNMNHKLSKIFIIFNCFKNFKNHFLQKKFLQKVFDFDYTFSTHLYLKGIKKENVFEKFEIALFNNIFFKDKQKEFFFLENLNHYQPFKKISSKKNFRMYNLFKTIIFYKKTITSILVKKNILFCNLRRIIKEIFDPISTFRKEIQKKFIPKCRVLGVFLKNLLNSSNFKIQSFSIKILKRILELKTNFFLNSYIWIKILFIEVFAMIFFKKPDYSTFFKLFEKNYISLSYLGDIFKILFCFLKIKKKILQKNCQIFICLLVLLSNLQVYSQISRSLKIKLKKINFLTELFYKNSFSLLFFTVSLHGFNLYFLKEFFKEFSLNFSKIVGYNRKYYNSSFFYLFLKKTEKNRINILFCDKKPGQCCFCFDEKSKFYIGWLLKFKNLLKIRRMCVWSNSLNFFNPCTKENPPPFPSKTMDNFLSLRNILLNLNEIQYGNIFLFVYSGNYFKTKIEEFFFFQKKFFGIINHPAIYGKVFYLYCYPSFIFYNSIRKKITFLGERMLEKYSIKFRCDFSFFYLNQVVLDMSLKVNLYFLKKCPFLKFFPQFENYNQSQPYLLPLFTPIYSKNRQSELFLIKEILIILNS
jgi:hypothetical protein